MRSFQIHQSVKEINSKCINDLFVLKSTSYSLCNDVRVVQPKRRTTNFGLKTVSYSRGWLLEFLMGGYARPDSMTSKFYIRGGDWKRGVKILRMTPNARKEGSILHQYEKSAKKGVKNLHSGGCAKYRCTQEVQLGAPELWTAWHKPNFTMDFKTGVKILHEWKNRGQNSISLKMGVKIPHSWKIGVKILQWLKKGVNILHPTPKNRSRNFT